MLMDLIQSELRSLTGPLAARMASLDKYVDSASIHRKDVHTELWNGYACGCALWGQG